MKRNIKFSLFLTSFLVISIVSWSQGVNDSASFQLDLLTNDSDSQTTSVIDETPVIDENNRFTATLVLKDATNLIGVNCDLSFDPNVLQVVEIREARGDLNFDGRANIADVRVLGERFNESTNQNGFSFFDLDSSDSSAELIDGADVQTLLNYVGETTLFWTQNDNTNADEPIRESVEIFQDPEDSNANGIIDDIVVVLLPRVHPDSGFEPGFGFDGDARIAQITFEIVDLEAASTEITFSDQLAIDEQTEVTTTEILNASSPQADAVTIPLQ